MVITNHASLHTSYLVFETCYVSCRIQREVLATALLICLFHISESPRSKLLIVRKTSRANTEDTISGPKPEFKPLQNVCEFLTAIHIYADEAREGKTRYVPAFHYCSHVRKDLRQCLIYDSHEKNARLIGVEYMVPKHVYETFPPEEQKLWHSHEFEVKSGMLILPKPEEHDAEAWEMDETKAMEEIIGLYGKTWHFWQTDAGHDFPFGSPRLMGSATQPEQVNLEEALAERNKTFGVDHKSKAEARKHIAAPKIHPEVDSWWKTAA